MYYFLLSFTYYLGWLMAIIILGLLCSPVFFRIYRKYKKRGFESEWKRVDWHSGNTHILKQVPVKRILEKIEEERGKDKNN